MATTTTQAELFKIQSEINTYVAQKEELYKLLKDSQTAYDIDLKNIGYSFESVSNLTPSQKNLKIWKSMLHSRNTLQRTIMKILKCVIITLTKLISLILNYQNKIWS